MIEITDEMMDAAGKAYDREYGAEDVCSWSSMAAALAAVAPLIAAAEREACAKVADDYARETFNKTAPAVIHSPAEWMAHGAEDVAEAIRGRPHA
jgi:hypothetical protein